MNCQTPGIIEVTFNPAGNTIMGDYSTYRKLDEAITAKKHCMFPVGVTISGERSDILRLADHVLTFGNAMKTLKAWKRICELAGCQFRKEQL